jgi:hypothetical protein
MLHINDEWKLSGDQHCWRIQQLRKDREWHAAEWHQYRGCR